MSKAVNYKIGALKRKFKTGRTDQEPGTFIKLAQQPKTETLSEKLTPTKLGIMGLI